MIILIKHVQDTDRLNQSQEAALEKLLCCFGRGTHVVWMPISLTEKLLKLNCFSSYAKRSLIELKRFSMESKHLIQEEFSFKMSIDFEKKYLFELNDKELSVGYERVLNDNFLLKPVLLAENELDSRVYSLFTLAFFSGRKKLNKSYEILIDPQGGGGTDTVKKFSRYIDEKRPFICILDSDKKHPKGRIGDTAKLFSNYKTGLTADYYLDILEYQEIENIIPTTIISELFPKVELGAMYKSRNLKKFKPYPDYKKGLKVSEAKKLDEHHQDRFWEEFYHLDNDSIICAQLKDILPKAKTFLESTTPHKIKEKLCEEIDSKLHSLSYMITDFGVALRRTLS